MPIIKNYSRLLLCIISAAIIQNMVFLVNDFFFVEFKTSDVRNII